MELELACEYIHDADTPDHSYRDRSGDWHLRPGDRIGTRFDGKEWIGVILPYEADKESDVDNAGPVYGKVLVWSSAFDLLVKEATKEAGPNPEPNTMIVPVLRYRM